MKTIKDLAVKHDYYCSDSNYNGLAFNTTYLTFQDFYNEMGNADDDMNLVFRFDICEKDSDEIYNDSKDSKYYMEIFIIQQRKGRFVPFMIENVYEEDFSLIKEYLQKKYNKINNLWSPFNK